MDLLVVFLLALAFYSATLAPAVVWGDSAAVTVRAVTRWVEFGTAGDHPLFVVIASLFAAMPGDPARNVNFVAALFGALAVMLVYRCARLLGCSALAASIGAASLAVSHGFWLHSVIAEVYTANAFFLVAVIALLLEWNRRDDPLWLAAAVAVFGIGLTNHLVLATAAPAAIIFVGVAKKRRLSTRSSLIWTSAAIVFGIAAAIFMMAVPRVSAAVQTAWYGPPGISDYFKLNFTLAQLAREVGFYVAYLAYQFPLALPLGLIGAVALLRERPSHAVLLLTAMVVNAAIFIKHVHWVGGAKYVFYISDYAIFAVLCAVGSDQLFRRFNQQTVLARIVPRAAIAALIVVFPPALYAAMPSIAARAGYDLVRTRTIPYRDNNQFFLNPNKRGEYGASRYGLEALAAAKPDAVIFADFTPYTVLRYFQIVEQRRPDVLVLAGAAFSNQLVRVRLIAGTSGPRPIYVAANSAGYYNFQDIPNGYDLVPAGPIFEVRPRVGQ